MIQETAQILVTLPSGVVRWFEGPSKPAHIVILGVAGNAGGVIRDESGVDLCGDDALTPGHVYTFVPPLGEQYFVQRWAQRVSASSMLVA